MNHCCPQLPVTLQLPRPPDGSDVDAAAVSKAVGSCLIATLLGAATAAGAEHAARSTLSVLHAEAAAKNDVLAVFKSKERFPEVHTCAEEEAGWVCTSVLEGCVQVCWRGVCMYGRVDEWGEGEGFSETSGF